MKLPNFLCIGAQKAGTTSLQDMLVDHPDIFLSRKKEIKYFHRDEHYAKGVEWYAEHFSDASKNQLIGDITPDYLLYNTSPNRILETLGKDVKIIVLLRNPVDRAYSQFNFHRAAKVENETNFKNIINNYGTIDDENNSFTNWYTPSYYIERGLYHNQLSRFLEKFPKGNFHVAIFEEFFGNRKEEELEKLYNFLGIKPIELTEKHSHSTRVPKKNIGTQLIYALKEIKSLFKLFLPKEKYMKLRAKILNATSSKPSKLDPTYKKELFNKYYANDVAQLEALLNRDLSVWK